VTLPGYATLEGTTTYQQRFSSTLAPAHFRESLGLKISSIGFGTYLGEADDATDTQYAEAIRCALVRGCNVLDTAINYRHQRSERVIGRVLSALDAKGIVKRAEVIVATKGGYLAFEQAVPPDPRAYIHETFIQSGLATADDIVEWNCIAPRYIDAHVERSLENLGLACLDIYYLHNPEAQLQKWSRHEFSRRIEAVFTVLEEKVAAGKIRCYGTATWNGYRQPNTARDHLSLTDLIAIAQRVGGQEHHFKVVQAPYNLAMPEVLTKQNQTLGQVTVSFLEAAHQLDVTVMASAAILQGKLAQQLPPFIREALPGLTTDAQRAIQFTRSTPGITTALVGMKSVVHVEQNMAVAAVPPASMEQFQKLFHARRSSESA
jgi:aryl-alcohol dehydrogenase-like predicted oxidoreductase